MASRQRKDTVIFATVDKAFHAQLKTYCRLTGIPMATLMREAVAKEFSKRLSKKMREALSSFAEIEETLTKAVK